MTATHALQPTLNTNLKKKQLPPQQYVAFRGAQTRRKSFAEVGAIKVNNAHAPNASHYTAQEKAEQKPSSRKTPVRSHGHGHTGPVETQHREGE